MIRKLVLTILGPSIAFAITGVDPLLLTLNLPAVSRGLHVPASQVGLLGGAATLMIAAVVLAAGALGDRYGLKEVLLAGLAASIAVNVLAALSPDYPFLLAMRLLDGCALAVLLGITLALLTVAVPAGHRPRAIGIFMAIDTVLYGVTPLAGGLLVHALGWRWLFGVPPLLAAVALALTARYVPATPRAARRSLDAGGVALSGLGLLALVYGVGEVPGGVSRPQAWVPLAASGLALAAFVLHERRARAPALDPGLFRQPAFAVAAVAIFTVNLLAAGFSVVLGQFGGMVLGLPAQQVGLLYLPGTGLIAGASILAGHLVARHAPRWVLITGLLIAAAGALIMAATASPAMALWALAIATWLGDLGYFVTAVPVSETILAHAPAGKAGSVAAVQPAFGMTGYALGTAVCILLLSVFFQREWLKNSQAAGLSVEQAQHAVTAVTGALAHSPGAARYDPALTQQASGLTLGLDFAGGVRLTMLIAALLPLAVAVLGFFILPRRARPGR